MNGIVLCGPTGVGKTELSLKLAKKFDADIISADSMQIYKYMDIGTAKINDSEMNKIKHHMLSIVKPTYKFSVGEYQKRVDAILNKLEDKNKNVILAGGTGLYIDSITRGLSNLPTSDEELREKMYNREKQDLHDELKKLDIKSANAIHPNNKRRVIRALEVCKLTGGKFSILRKQNIKNNNYSFKKFALTRDREELYKRINIRVEQMFDSGLLDEARFLYDNYREGLNQIRAIGYTELFDYFEEKTTLKEAKRLIKRNSRRYAKRQYTWFKKDDEISWFNLSSISKNEILNQIIKQIK
ncbi:MAG: tRNA (adenosine(37)-N6)-dimethylallyltransferase MiaA, partial [Fusobacteriota bacterium]